MEISNSENITVATLGSHCSLQVLKGAKDEGFSTLLICEKKRINLYKRFRFIDTIIEVERFSEILFDEVQQKLHGYNCVIVPHGTLISQMNSDEIEGISNPFFGNRNILRWESDRLLKQKLMDDAGLETPKMVPSKNELRRLSIVKLHGAAGGRGYFLASNKEMFEEKARVLIDQKVINSEQDLYIQEYSEGVPVYLQYFYSPVNNELEFMGVDKRYESNVDALGRIPANQQLGWPIDPSYTVIGNFPLVIRESLLEGIYRMGEQFTKAAEWKVPPGMPGPFCLEGVYDNEGRFTTFEFSARIVAGTNLYLSGSPYSDLIFDEPMSMGRRIAREIKVASKKNMLDKIIT